MKIDRDEIVRILTALGCDATKETTETVTLDSPTWRHDLTREADLIEEVARIHGYEKIPEDSPIPVTPSSRREFDHATEKARRVLTSAGLSEAMTPSIVTVKLDESLSPWTDRPSLATQTAMLKGAKRLRRSLIPSLLEGRAGNWAAASIEANLFEIAHIYLPSESKEGLPTEEYAMGMVCGGDFFQLKGILSTLCQRFGIRHPLTVKPTESAGFTQGGFVELHLADKLVGYLGKVDPKTLKTWKLPGEVVAAELSPSQTD